MTGRGTRSARHSKPKPNTRTKVELRLGPAFFEPFPERNSMSALLEIRGATRIFPTPEGGTVTALGGVDLEIAVNEFVTLLGPSGCGKTTLLRAIAGFEDLDAGSIHLDGQDMLRVPTHKRPVNTVFQSYALFSHMNVGRNIGYSLEVAGMGKAEREQEIGRVIELVGLTGMEQRNPSQLSGGQRQRVALARALVAKPKLLLLDEPLSALDRQLRQQMQVELKALQDELGVSFVFVTHDQEEALTMSDRIVVMRAGAIEQIGTPREIYRKPKTRFVADFIGETNLIPVNVIVENGDARAETSFGYGFDLPDDPSIKPGPKNLVLRPTDFEIHLIEQSKATGIPGAIIQEIYLGSDLHYLVAPDAGGDPIRVTARDSTTSRTVGDKVFLGHDPDAIHLMEAE